MQVCEIIEIFADCNAEERSNFRRGTGVGDLATYVLETLYLALEMLLGTGEIPIFDGSRRMMSQKTF